MTADVVVAGQLARDLVLVVEDVPEAGKSRPVRERREMLGGRAPTRRSPLPSSDCVPP